MRYSCCRDAGARRWQISRQKDHSFVPGRTRRILQALRGPTRNGFFESGGDMLYLRPVIRARRIAESEWPYVVHRISRPPRADRDIVAGFATFPTISSKPTGRYGDPGVAAHTTMRAESAGYVAPHRGRALNASVRWTAQRHRDFSGAATQNLSERSINSFSTPPPASALLSPIPLPVSRSCAAHAGLVLTRFRRGLLFSPSLFWHDVLHEWGGRLPSRALGARPGRLAHGIQNWCGAYARKEPPNACLNCFDRAPASPTMQQPTTIAPLAIDRGRSRFSAATLLGYALGTP